MQLSIPKPISIILESEILEAQAQYDFTARSSREVSFRAGDTILLYAQVSQVGGISLQINLSWMSNCKTSLVDWIQMTFACGRVVQLKCSHFKLGLIEIKHPGMNTIFVGEQ